jgi:phospholipid transport system transporter-binding protein
VSTAAHVNAAPRAGRAKARLRRAAGGHYSLEGVVTLANVTGLRSAGLRAFARGHGLIKMDLSGVTRADSGALALLVDWLAWAQAAHRELKYSAPPAALLALARVSDVEDLLLGKST